MTRFVIDAPTTIELLRAGVVPAAGHQLVAPSLLRSEVLDQLYRSTRRGDQSSSEGRRLLSRFAELPIRLLGDRMSRGTAWKMAEELGCTDTANAEYLAVTRLQADALVALDPGLRELAEGVVPLAPLTELLAACAREVSGRASSS